MVDILSGVAGIKSAYELAKSVKAGVDKYDDAQVKMQMADLVQALAEATLDASEKSVRIHDLEQQIANQKNLVYVTPYYKSKQEDGSLDGPFCQHCYDKEQKIIRLQKWDTGSWRCFSCNNSFYDDDHVSPDDTGRGMAPGWV